MFFCSCGNKTFWHSPIFSSGHADKADLCLWNHRWHQLSPIPERHEGSQPSELHAPDQRPWQQILPNDRDQRRVWLVFLIVDEQGVRKVLGKPLWLLHHWQWMSDINTVFNFICIMLLKIVKNKKNTEIQMSIYT